MPAKTRPRPSHRSRCRADTSLSLGLAKWTASPQ